MHRRLAAVVTLLTTTALLAFPASSGSAADRDDRAERALARVDRIFDGTRSGRADDATLALLELRGLQHELDRADRQRAKAYFARPTEVVNGDGFTLPPNPDRTCTVTLCVHYTTSGENAATDAYAELVKDTAQHVHRVYRRAGYRAPKPDAGQEGGRQIDIYVGDLGNQGIYGYCFPEEAGVTRAYGYCAVDNDYAPAQYGTATSQRGNLKVTVAHEYFHAIQFNYDSYEGWNTGNPWFMEATATWAEDEVFDGVNDNVQFLDRSPITFPAIPLSRYESPNGSFQYGTWIWFRFLTERWPAEQGALPVLVRQAWERAVAPGDNAFGALQEAIAVNGGHFDRAFASFGAVNRRSRVHYDEGARQRYPRSPLERTMRVGRQQAVGGTTHAKPLTNHTVRAVARGSMTSKRWRVRVRVESGRPGATEGVATIHWRGGGVAYRRIELARNGVGVRELPFSRARVRRIELTMANASPGAAFDVIYRFTPRRR